MNSDGFCDAHLHLTEDASGSRYDDLLSASVLMSCTSRRTEWGALSALDEPRAIRSYGIHPWFADEWCPDAEEELLSRIGSGGCHVGEIGLDSKRGTVAGQMPAFTDQLRIASENDRVVTIHMVGTEKEVLDAIRAHGDGTRGIILHSYGSDSYARPFSELGCYLSISPRILSRSQVRVSRLLGAIPRDRLLLETDHPHSGKDFTGMADFAEKLSACTDLSGDELISLASDNLRRLLS